MWEPAPCRRVAAPISMISGAGQRDSCKMMARTTGRSRVGNRSFESSILGSRPDGWRPDNGKSAARWVEEGSEAKDGTAFVRCAYGYGVHQAVDAQPGEQFRISVWAKAGTGNQGILKYQFRDQQQKNIQSTIKAIALTDQWQRFEFTTEVAMAGTWQIDVILRAEHDAIVDYDLIEMTRLR